MRIGIDLGGTKIAAVLLDDDGRERWERRTATPRDDYAATLDAIAGLVTGAESSARSRCSVGIGIPGAISPATHVIKNANSTWLNGHPLQADLEARLDRPVRLANDANCLAVSEATDGAGAGADVVFAVILGTGTGSGIVAHGRLVVGHNAIGGEWGHNPLPWPEDDERPGPRCYCGRDGCIETFLSGPGIARDYVARGGAPSRSEEIAARADAGEILAQETLAAWDMRLAKSLATIVNVLDPDVVVIGGGLSRLARIYDAVPRLWAQWVFSDVVSTPVVPAMHGDASGVRGAAWLWGGRG